MTKRQHSDTLASTDKKGGSQYQISDADENKMNVYYAAGLAAGVLVGILFIFIFLKVTKTDGKMKCKYDERQNTARGNGFKYGFFTLLICNLLQAFAFDGKMSLPVDQSVILLISVVLGILVYVSYCIWNDAYFSLNENRRKVLVGFVVIGVFNLLIGISNLHSGKAFTDGVLNFRSINLFCGLLFLVIFAVLLAKHLTKKQEEEDE